ncbi:MAG: phospho-N-acetylmuramoyl-pentapeptide-transferase, partial [Chloroflexi bacterium]|nr:phospho-N-acetylmuramoyl-pentapeptide-transferase [Chloroflexota bacterium]
MTDISFALTLGSITFLLTVIWGGPFLELLRRFKIGKQIRVDGPQTHFTKMGTPTMGGLMIIGPVLVITAILNVVSLVKPVIGRSVLLPLAVLAVFALLGMRDDWEGLRGTNARRGEGMLARYKFLVQVILALGVVLVLYYGLGVHSLALP